MTIFSNPSIPAIKVWSAEVDSILTSESSDFPDFVDNFPEFSPISLLNLPILY